MTQLVFTLLGVFLFTLGSSLAKTFANDNLIVDKPIQSQEGNQTSFYCQLPVANPSIILTACQFITPDGSIWSIENGVITDESGQIVDAGYTAFDLGNPDTACGIQIEALHQQDFGDWTCSLTRSGGATTVIRGVINLHPEHLIEENLQLPNHVTPISYNLDIIISLEPDFLLDGHFEVNASVSFGADPETSISVNFRDMSFVESSLKMSDETEEDLPITGFTYDFEREIFAVHFHSPTSGESLLAALSGDYRAPLSTANEHGFYRDSYIDVATGEQVWLAVTQFEPTDARMAFPCMDEPNLKAIFNVRLGHKDTLTAQANGALVRKEDPVDGYPGYVWSEFEPTPVMSSYIVAFAVTDFAPIQADPMPSGIDHSIWARYDVIDAGLADYMAAVGPLILQSYIDTFSVPYALPKMEMIAPPSKRGAMENWGLITYSETGLLIDMATCSARDEMELVSIQSHECAHQWFGDLVTCDWWSYVWLNEGFATCISYIGMESAAPQFRGSTLFVYREVYRALQVDTLFPHALSDAVVNPALTYYGPITYKKGASVIRMAEHFLTHSTWVKGLTECLNDHSFSNVVPDDFFTALDEAGKEDGTLEADKSVKTILDTWTLQGNYPVVTVTRDYVAGTATLTQERFHPGPSLPNNTHDCKWWIPITYSTVGDELSNFEDTYNYNQWFPADSNAVTVTTGGQNSPVIFNVQFTSFYRTNYDNENWKRIAQALQADPFLIHESNRAQLLSDSYELAKAGILPDYDVPANISSYLAAETQYVPVAVAAANLRDLTKHNNAPDFAAALFSSFVALYTNIGMSEQIGASWNFNMVQLEVIDALCSLDYQPCLDDANSAFSSWMSSPDPDDLRQNPINRHVRSSVYCTAIRTGGDAEYNFIADRLANTRNPQERNNLKTAQGCKPEVQALVKTLEDFIYRPYSYHSEIMVKNLAENAAFIEALEELDSKQKLVEHD